MTKRLPHTYNVTVHMMRRDTAATQDVQMSDTVMAEDLEEAKDIALVECAASAAKHFPAWKVMKFEFYSLRIAADAAWGR